MYVIIEIYCKKLESDSTSVVCMQNGKYVPCSNLVPGTEAILRCLDGYHREEDIGSIRTKCNKNGDWFPQPIQCIPGSMINIYINYFFISLQTDLL